MQKTATFGQNGPTGTLFAIQWSNGGFTILEGETYSDDLAQDIDDALGLDVEEESSEWGYAVVMSRHDDEGKALRLKLDCHCTDVGNAKRFVARHGKNVRYCTQTGTWYIWDGRRWAVDTKNTIMQKAREVAECIDIEADFVKDIDPRERIKKKEELISWAKKSENDHRLMAMVSQAKSFPEIAVTTDQFDTDRMKLNCLNGTFDLELFTLEPHRRGDLITKLAPVNYDPDATFNRWDAFLDKVLPNEALRSYVQRATGYSLTGLTSEEVLFYICGPTASGKSTFIEAVKATLGDYADTADFDAFLKRKMTGSPRNDIARLNGARFVSSIEVDEGKALAEALIKTITGNETITARFLHNEFFTFRPQFKLFFAANIVPEINAQDEAVWRRIHIIPFDVSIPDEERDPAIKEHLRTPELAGGAILRWMVDGCRQWQVEQLKPPDDVKATTKKYRLLTSELKRFITDRCVLGPAEFEPSSSLYNAYDEWCKSPKNKGVIPLDRKQFGRRLKGHGCVPKKKRLPEYANPVRVWKGIGLREYSDSIDEDGLPAYDTDEWDEGEQQTFEP
ncbi:MAG: DNA primase family protein [Halobacteriota archaeon]